MRVSNHRQSSRRPLARKTGLEVRHIGAIVMEPSETQLANNVLEELAQAAKEAPTHVRRAQLLTDRVKVLQFLGAVQQAGEEAESVAQELKEVLAAWRHGSLSPRLDRVAGSGNSSLTAEARERHSEVAVIWEDAITALNILSDVISELRSLGREDRANNLLASTIIAATELGAASAWLRSLAQLTALTDEQLAGVLSCVALLEQGEGPSAVGCTWLKPALKGDEPLDLHRMYYAASRGLHARKNYSEAWRHLVEAKRRHGGTYDYTAPSFDTVVDDTAKLFPLLSAPSEAMHNTAAQLAQAASEPGSAAPKARLAVQKGSPWSRPIFVLGLPRSGSTLVEQILASHPDVWGTGEHTSLHPLAKRLSKMLAANGTATPEQLAELRLHYLDAARAKVPEQHRSRRWVVDKNLDNSWYVGHIAAMMPEACIIHAVRHPADTALSCYQQSFFPSHVPWSFSLKNIEAYMAAHHRMMQHWDQLLPGRVLHVHYSDMVKDQEGTTRRVIEHCGLPWHPNLLRFYETKRTVLTSSKTQVNKPIYKTSLGKWEAYADGLAPLLVGLRDMILRYEEQAGLPSSQKTLDRLGAQLQQEQEQAPAGGVTQPVQQPRRKPDATDPTAPAVSDTTFPAAAGSSGPGSEAFNEEL